MTKEKNSKLNYWINYQLDLWNQFEVNIKKPNRKNTQTLLQQAALLIDTNITENGDPIEKKKTSRRYTFSPWFITEY